MAFASAGQSLFGQKIVVAIPGDGEASALTALINALAAERNHLFIECVDPVAGLGAVRAHFAAVAQGRALLLVANDGAAVVGLITGSRVTHPARQGVVDIGIGVHPAMRGRGVGMSLMRGLEEHARRLGCYRLQLHVVTKNASAIALYRKQGFVIEGELHATAIAEDQSIDEFAMAKLLTP